MAVFCEPSVFHRPPGASDKSRNELATIFSSTDILAGVIKDSDHISVGSYVNTDKKSTAVLAILGYIWYFYLSLRTGGTKRCVRLNF
ncbi:MAG: hypothetical protein A4E53_03090 [Pelotomaculum sp. PtaB.Bin104]|nr:MAG: hypothetical protein A4E53_03090 [Pelotomaculum sp. PtaB.Bin104]